MSIGTLAGSGNSGSITLTNSGNQVGAIGALAANGIAVRDAASDLSVTGAVAGGSGAVLLTTTGNLIQSQAVGSSAGGDAVVLSAGGSYSNTAGSSALSAPSGRWLVYSANPAADSFGGLVSGNTARYDATYDSVAPASIASGNRYVFAYQPTVTIAADAQTKTYDGAAGFSSLTYSASPLVDASAYGNVFLQDTLSGALGVAGAGRNVGTYSIVQGTLAAPTGYATTFTGATGTITPAPLVLAAASDTRVYDGGTASSQAVTISGLASGDTVSSLSQSFGSRNVLGTGGSTLAVNGGFVVNDGNGGANYTTSTSTATGTITPAPLALSATGDTRVYDGTTASLQGPSSVGLAAGDTVSSLSQSFASRHALGTGGSTLAVNGGYVVNDGNGGANYTVATNTAPGTITPAPLVINAVTDSRVYDGTTASSQTPTSSGLVVGDTLSGLWQAFASRNAQGAGGSTLQVGGYVVNDGNGGANYTVATNTAAGTITPAPLAISATSDSRVYDGGTTSALTPTSSGLVGGDTLASLFQAFASRNVQGAGGSTLQVGGYVVNDGNGGANYAVTTNTAPGTITPAPLALNAVSDSRVYDGTTNSSRTVATSGLVGGDTVSSLSQSYASRNVLGTGASTLQVNGGYVVNDGNGGANYAVSTTNAAGTITPAPLTLSAATDNRVYDGTTASSQAVVIGGLAAGDNVSSLSQSFASRNVLGTGGSTLLVNGGYVVNDGNGGANYTVGTSTASGTITPASLTLAAASDSRVYDGGTTSSLAPVTTGLVGGDSVASLSQSFASRNAGGNTLLVNGGYVVNDGNGGANYTVATSTASGTITPASLTLSAVGDTRVYDGTVVSSLAPSAGGLVGGDTVTSLSQSFASRNAGGNTLVVNGGYVVNDGNGGANYTVTSNSASGMITPATLTLNALSDSRVYDGTTASGLTPSPTGLVGGDTVSSLSQSFASRNAGSNTLAVNGGYVVNDGNGGGNYTVATNTAPGTITPALLTLNAASDSRVYDGTVSSSVTPTAAGLVGGDTVGSLSQSFGSRNVLGTGGSTLQVNGGYVVNDGNGGGNYTVATGNASGTITPASLTLSAVADTRIYDGTTGSAQAVGTSGLLGGDTVSSLSQSFASRNVLGTGGSTLQVNGGYAINDGNGGANYSVVKATAAGTITPASLTLNAASDSRVYDGSTVSSQAPTASGLLGSDTATGLTQSFASRNAGSNTLQVNSGYAINDGNGGANYTVSMNTAAGTITPAALTLSASTDSRVYDGTTTSAQTPTAAGLVGGDTMFSLTQSFASRNVLGTGGSTLQVDGYAVNDGNGGANYTVSTSNAAGTITPAALTLNATSDSRVYDGTTASSQAVTVTGLMGSDNVSFLSQSFASRNVLGTGGSTLAVNSGYVVNDGNGGGNYSVVRNNASGTITAATLILNAATDTRVYDGGTTSSQAVTTTGLVAGDTVSSLSQSFADRNVLGPNGSTLQVNAGYVVNDGNGGANYTVSRKPTAGTITPATLTLSAVADSRVYDGGTASMQAPSAAGLVGGDTVSSLSQSFASKNVLGTNGSTLQVDAGYAVNDGNGGANYTVATNSAAGTITQAPLTLNAATDSRVYDGTTASAQAPTATGLLGRDTIASLSQSFTSKNVQGAGNSTLQVDAGYVLSDDNGGANYAVTRNTAAGTVTPAPLTLNAVVDGRVYDGTVASGKTPTSTGLVGGDTIASLSQSFTSRNAGSAGLRVDGGYVLNDGNGGANYTVTTNGATGTITPAALTLAAVTDARVYDGTTASTGTVGTSGLVAGDTVSSLSQSFASRNVLGTGGSTLQVNGGYVVNDGNGGGNYTVASETAAGTITPASLTLNAVTDSRAYDGGTASSRAPSATGLFSADTVGSLSQSFVSRNVLGTNGSTLQVDGGYVVSDGNGGANYSVVKATAAGTITPAPLTLNAASDSRVYDGSTASSQTPTASGLVGGDTATGLAQSFASRNAGSNTLQVNGGYVVNDGNGGANYAIDTRSAPGTITPAPVTLSVEDISKVYDGTTSASGTATVRGGTLFGADSLSGGSYAFADRNAGTGKTVSVAGVTVNDGNGGGNYSVSYADNVKSAITQRPLSTWTGAAGTGLWSSAANWDALPDASNVLAVSIPAGALVTYDLPGLTSLRAISSAGGFGIASGTLQVAESAQTQGYSQTGGVLAGAGSLQVNGLFTQSGGTIDLAGKVGITQASGDLQVGAIRASAIALQANGGSITQGGALVTSALSASAQGSITLENAGNHVAGFEARSGGAIAFTNTGGIETTGLVSSSGGGVAITANSPLTVGASGIDAAGDVVLVASNLTSAGYLTLNGPVVSRSGVVRLNAGADLVQNQLVQGGNGVTASAEGAILFGPSALTIGVPVAYSAAGVAVTPPTAGPLDELVQIQNQQIAGDLLRLETVATLFVEEAERQRVEHKEDAITITDTACRR